MSKFIVTIDGVKHEVDLPTTLEDQSGNQSHAAAEFPALYSVLVDGLPTSVAIVDWRDTTNDVQCLVVDDRPLETTIDSNFKWIKSPWGVHTLDIRSSDSNASLHYNGNGNNHNQKAGNGRIKSPIPGLIIQVRVTEGETIEAGQSLFILEAMKMQNEIRAPRSGIIKSIRVSPGQSVVLNQILAEME
jgi:biotin carboxyl carrier protein